MNEKEKRQKRERNRIIIIFWLIFVFCVLYIFFLLENYKEKEWRNAEILTTYNHVIDYQQVNKSKISELKGEDEFDRITSKYKIISAQKYELSCEINIASIVYNTLLSKWLTEDEIIATLKTSSPYINKQSQQISVNNWQKTKNKWTEVKEEGLPKNKEDKEFYSYKELMEWDYIWWDPDKWFVWEVNWSQRKMTGYWVNEKPLIKFYNKNKLITGHINKDTMLSTSPEQVLIYLLKQVQEWKMVQLWWDYCSLEKKEDATLWRWKISNEELSQKKWRRNTCNKRAFENRRIYWYAPTENNMYYKVDTIIWEHNFLLLWYKSDWEKLTHIKVYDSYTWYHTYSTEEWLRKWSLLDYRTLIISK